MYIAYNIYKKSYFFVKYLQANKSVTEDRPGKHQRVRMTSKYNFL